MKLTLRPEWRLRPLSSAFGFLDLKTAVTVALLFAVLNKVAGVYGLIAMFTGAGGTAAQLSMYIYSTIALAAVIWGMKSATQENAKQTLYFAHLFFADHILNTAWLIFFAVMWWVYTRTTSGPAIGSHNMTEEERVQAAMTLWHAEKGLATGVIVLGWLAKFYFAALLYSYAIHLRKGSYRSLPRSRPSPTITQAPLGLVGEDEDDDIEDFYRIPVRAPANGHARQSSASHASSPSLSSFADFVSAPPPGRARRKAGKSNLSVSLSAANGKGDTSEPDEVLFDEDELSAAGHLRMGTSAEESTSGDESVASATGSRRSSRANTRA
ncbi:Inositolphosphorylceramide synthase subunit Kei1-domain-containing protein [Fomitopsis serialis]|uniref:Inositolphosphorylceramide synthase subunit Kei1-domain-containing protein n=1 Tax=Fomitopsis serialis TaxID=139415 RepID=UPI0020082451|nr:Inositolphosphorylceramide synthase subunit Kei1-domain-containing protein [Neoantrodia serialis]KAH9933336.1 Inositolphosphorylceramide synthase subunit Kei1-domain-containing protein [Neoantrodia serialis]